MIIDLQRRIQEAGRIRIGQQVPAGKKTRPAKLDTFRLTSADKIRIDQAASLYGGTPQQWDAPAGPQWEVITQTDSLDVIVPPTDMAFSQWYEQWSAGGCQRRCDGARETLSDGPCLCDPDNRDCDIHTRLSVMLADLPGLGVWRIDTSGYYAAVELSGAVQVVQSAAGRGVMLPARLRLEQRTVKRPGTDGKPQTLRFAVPVLDVDITPSQLVGGRPGTQHVSQLEQDQPEPPRLTPVPENLPTPPSQSIAEQAAPPPAKPPRKNAAPEIPSTGRQRRTIPYDAPSEEQHKKMHALLGELGLADRQKYIALAAWHTKRPALASTTEMTRDEITTFIDYLEQRRNTEQAATDQQPELLNPSEVIGEEQ